MLGDVLDNAIAMLERDAPHYASGMAACLERCPIGVEIHDEAFTIVSDRERVKRVGYAGSVTVEIKTTSATVLSLLEGELSLLEAIRRDALRLRGTAESISALQDALDWFLLGCARCSGAPELLKQLRGHAMAQTNEVAYE